MQAPSIPDNESQRLQALRAQAILDTPAEERFDRLTRLGRHMFGTQIALVSLVDADRQWFKSRQGLDACETGRNISFCGHAILDDAIFEITDARIDPRFADNPLVTGPPHIRFYAGAPLATADGSRIGTLCIIDEQPRQLSAAERCALRDLADCVEAEINQDDQLQQSRALRKARQLGEVIARAQSQFIREADRRKAFDGLLADILALTESEYGFVGEVLHRNDGSPYLKTYAITNIAWDDATRAFYEAHAPQGMEFTNFKTLFGAAMTSGEPVIANDPYHDPRRGGLPEGHPAMNAFLGIPVHHGGALVAMLGIANRPGGYDQALIDFLHPLLVTLGQLVDAVRVQERHREGQIELARLSRVASQTTNGVLITDADGRVEWINEGFTRIAGYTLDDMRGRKPGELLQGAATDPAMVTAMRSALACHEGFEIDIVNYKKSGEPYWIRINCNPLLDASGALQGFMAVESDITAQKQAEEHLQETTSLLEGIFENVPSMIFLKDASDLHFRYFNRAGEALIGHARENLIGRNDYDLFPREQADAFIASDRAVLAQTGVVDIPEEEIETPHGTRILHTQKLTLRDALGLPQYLLGISEDITDKKKAQAEIELNESRLRGLFELSPIGIALNDYETGRFVDLNDALLAPTGYTREEFIALSYWDLTPREYEPQEALQLDSMEKTGRYGPHEKEYIRKDGSRYPVLLNGMVVHDPSGRKLIWSIVEDISERKRMERMKSEFVSTVSHELRTPLTAISGALGLIAGGALGTLPQQAGQMVALAHKNSQRLAHLIDDLLDMEKLLAGKLRFELRTQPLMPLIDGAIRDNQTYADPYGVRLDFTERTDGVVVDVDSLRLQQVLANLFSNAAKFSPQGGVVVVRASLRGKHVRIAVTDQGPGVPAAFRHRIFQKFSQADASDTRQRGGSGLGLAISRELMEHMGGTLSFESVEGEGATFYFELPLCTAGQVVGDRA